MSSVEYFNLQKIYENLYGSNTVILYNIGSFYQIWGYDAIHCSKNKYKIDIAGVMWNNSIGHAFNVSMILNHGENLHARHKPYSFDNPYKIGFLKKYFDQNLRILLDNNYTVVIKQVIEIYLPDEVYNELYITSDL